MSPEDAECSSSQSTSKKRPSSSTIKPVVTVPPWARHEPPSPELETDPTQAELTLRPSTSAISVSPAALTSSDVASLSSTATSAPDYRKWKIPLLKPLRRVSNARSTQRPPSLHDLPVTDEHPHPNETVDPRPATSPRTPQRTATSTPLRLQIPHNDHSFTLAHSKTPGWATPWAPQAIFRPHAAHLRSSQPPLPLDPELAIENEDEEKAHSDGKTAWRRHCRTFLLTNTYVPLLFRLLNFTFTTATLGVALRIRSMEIGNNIVGAVGSSPLIAIIFAPLTLMHVMVAIYLEYFGRPLGLWKTSAKLAHTVFEVVFICMWSGSLSVAFENYFTSPLLCAPSSANTWWDHLPAISDPLGNQTGRHQGGIADSICNDQLVMICLEAVGLSLYCSNLVISLFRIFEKVKYHTNAVRNYMTDRR